MQKPLKEIKSQDRTVWLTQPHELEALLRKTSTAFDVAKGKYAESKGNVELVMQTAEAFGRGLFAEHIQDKPAEWTVKEWIDSIVAKVFNPMGTGATFTRITEEEAQTLLFRNLLFEDSGDPRMASLFTYGLMRGLFLSAFPRGELLMKSAMARGAPMSEFVFKTRASRDDRFERERIKNVFK